MLRNDQKLKLEQEKRAAERRMQTIEVQRNNLGIAIPS